MAYHPSQMLLAMKSLCPGLVLHVDFELADRNDGSGPFISVWNSRTVTQPTMAQVEAIDTDALLKEMASFYARELLAQFTPEDYSNIMKAVGSNAALGLLWSALLAQGEAPIAVSSDRFQQGWTGIKTALGVTRATAIAAAIGIEG